MGRRGKLAAVLTIAGIGLVALNLRAGITSVGPVLEDVRDSLSLSGTEAAVLTMLPVLCFGLLGPLGPLMARRIGIEWSLGLAVAGVAVGLAIRVLHGPALLYFGTAVMGASIAVANVLLPALVKRDFPEQAGLATGLYFTALGASAAIAAGLTAPIEREVGHGWRGALGIWAVLAFVGLVVWLPQLRAHTPPEEPPPRGAVAALLRDPRAWQVTVFLGLQSLCFYSTVSWVATLYRDEGWTKAHAGALLAVITSVGIPAGLIAPTLAARRPNQSGWGMAATALIAAGFAGLAFAPLAAPWVWAILLGLGLNMVFPIVLTVFVLRSRTTADAARLSAMAQSIGYVLAAFGPLLVGLLHDLTDSWTTSFAFLLGVSLLQLGAAYGAGRAGYVGAAERSA
jgi:CP family cyanate transporter-like MFS transporter